jgi:hypothetical protein
VRASNVVVVDPPNDALSAPPADVVTPNTAPITHSTPSPRRV